MANLQTYWGLATFYLVRNMFKCLFVCVSEKMGKSLECLFHSPTWLSETNRTTFFKLWLLSKLAASEVPKGKETYQQDPVNCPQWGWVDSHSDHSAFAKAEAGEDFSGASENPYGIHACFYLPNSAYIFLALKRFKKHGR